MFFSEEFIREVEEDPVTGIFLASKMSLEHLHEMYSGSNPWSELEHEFLWEVSSFMNIIIEDNSLDVNFDLPIVTSNIQENCDGLHEYIIAVKEKFEEPAVRLKIESYNVRYKAAFKNTFSYEFSQGDLERIQTLINELRNHISASTCLEKAHQQRLLRRLEKLQAELHKRVSDLDRFWGLVGDAGVVFGKLGKDAKPIVDRIREMSQIAWRTQARTEELPSSASNPVLENEDESA